MIPFFRRLRQQLANDNKPLKYFRYAIGEIVLVVIGILIALSINTWNQNRINKTLEQELLNNLLSDVEADIRNLKFQDSMMALAFFSKVRILDYVDGAPISEDSVLYYLSKTGPLNLFNPTMITYDEMKNSDGFKVISSKDIRREIAVLYRKYEELDDAEQIYVNYHTRLGNIRIEDFSTGSLVLIGMGELKDKDQVIGQIKTNQRFINALQSNYTGTLSTIYKETLLKVENFKSKLIAYINQ